MPTFIERFGHLIGRTLAPSVQRSVAGRRLCTSTFSQCREPVLSYIYRDDLTAYGICEALSAYWIMYHAEGGSLWERLMTPGGGFVWQTLYEIRRLQSRGVATDQRAVTEAFFKNNGIVRLKGQGAMPLGPDRIKVFFGERIELGAKFSGTTLANAIVKDFTRAGGRSGGQYKFIAITGFAGGHRMAAWVAEDVCFFDPNFGEFYFPTAWDFADWFPTFWLRSMYVHGLSANYEIETYSKKLF